MTFRDSPLLENKLKATVSVLGRGTGVCLHVCPRMSSNISLEDVRVYLCVRAGCWVADTAQAS